MEELKQKIEDIHKSLESLGHAAKLSTDAIDAIRFSMAVTKPVYDVFGLDFAYTPSITIRYKKRKPLSKKKWIEAFARDSWYYNYRPALVRSNYKELRGMTGD